MDLLAKFGKKTSTKEEDEEITTFVVLWVLLGGLEVDEE